jgi:sortilin (neurotensin receptor 3)/BNR-Asp box repeat protein
VLVLAGTRKGLFVLEGDESRRKWQVNGPLLPGWEVFHAIVDPRDGTLYACTNTFAYGANVHRSNDRGKTWEHAEQLGLPEDGELKLEKTWHIEPGRDSELWLGGAPGVLFRSDDGGANWELVRSLFEHPTRERWQPGAGGMCCHSIQIGPERTMYVGISAAGVFRSDDAGESWSPANKGTAADFMPDDPFPEVGQCVHKLLRHPADDDRLWQQNHCGVYRSDDRGESWERLEGNGLPSGFGFPIALHPRDPDVAYVVPEEGAENRVTADGRLGVYKTTDGGASWQLTADGLPDPAWIAVLREGMAYDHHDPAGVYVGTQSGTVFVSADEGESWLAAAENLPPVLSVEVGAWDS